MEDDDRFCKKCGAEVGAAATHSRQSLEKNVALAVIGSAIIAGVGQLYLGKIARGVCFILVSFLATGIYMGVFRIAGMEDPSLGILSTGYAVTMAIVVAIKIWSMIDAYKLAHKYNDHLKKTGTPPW